MQEAIAIAALLGMMYLIARFRKHPRELRNEKVNQNRLTAPDSHIGGVRHYPAGHILAARYASWRDLPPGPPSCEQLHLAGEVRTAPASIDTSGVLAP